MSGELQELRCKRPLIHCITNHISMNDMANIVLAAGGRPIMAEHPREAAEITKGADSVLYNLGNISDTRIEAIRASYSAAREKNLAVTLDVVGVGCSALRLDFAKELLESRKIAVIKGNISELRALLGLTQHARGVDAGDEGDSAARAALAKAVAERFEAVAVVSGACDVISDGKRARGVQNGSAMMGALTGTGCLQGALIATFLAAFPPFRAAELGAALLGTCGECGARGPAELRCRLIDGVYCMTDSELSERMRVIEL